MAGPNTFELTGHAIHVRYDVAAIDGKPRLSYHSAAQSLTFTGDEIETVETSMGTVVSVPILKSVDAGWTSFSVVIPHIRMAKGERSATVHTQAITALHRSSQLPTFGQLDSYSVSPLHGQASIIES